MICTEYLWNVFDADNSKLYIKNEIELRVEGTIEIMPEFVRNLERDSRAVIKLLIKDYTARDCISMIIIRRISIHGLYLFSSVKACGYFLIN